MLPLRRENSVRNPHDKQGFVTYLPKSEPITPLLTKNGREIQYRG